MDISVHRSVVLGIGMTTVLIVEDREQILALARSFLEDQGRGTRRPA